MSSIQNLFHAVDMEFSEIELTCPNISKKIENGDLRISHLTVGSTANYSCNPGFRIQPDQGHRRALTLNCVQVQGSQTAKWDKVESTCIIDGKINAVVSVFHLSSLPL